MAGDAAANGNARMFEVMWGTRDVSARFPAGNGTLRGGDSVARSMRGFTGSLGTWTTVDARFSWRRSLGFLAAFSGKI